MDDRPLKLTSHTRQATPFSGNFHLYDPSAKLPFSGEVGAASLSDKEYALYVQGFNIHIRYATGFHKRKTVQNTIGASA